MNKKKILANSIMLYSAREELTDLIQDLKIRYEFGYRVMEAE